MTEKKVAVVALRSSLGIRGISIGETERSGATTTTGISTLGFVFLPGQGGVPAGTEFGLLLFLVLMAYVSVSLYRRFGKTEDEDDEAETDTTLPPRERLRGQIDEGLERVERAENLFEGGNYYGSHKEFQSAMYHFESVLAQAKDLGYSGERSQADDLVRLCTANANEARRALYNFGSSPPEITPIEEFQAADGESPGEGEASRGPSYRTEVEVRLQEELPEHEVLEWIGSGGNADVHKVRLQRTDRVAALKVPRWQGTLSIEVIERFVQEAETWEQLDDHENIVTVYNWGTAPYPWLLLQYGERSLREAYEELSVTERLSVVIDVADALEYAHGLGVVHLDVKPENVLLDRDGTPLVADWGLARILLEHTETRMGLSPPYSAPEQLTGDSGDIDRRTDVYQLGVVAYEMVTGRLPFEDDRPTDLQRQILEESPTPPSAVNPKLPSDIDSTVLSALAKERTKRYEAVILFRNELDEVLDSITDRS